MFRPYFRGPLMLLALLLAGCSTMNGPKFGGNAQSKQIAVVGDRAMPATVGEPGGLVSADAEEPEPRRDPKARISGRVYDDEGKPVPDATVRLADGKSLGGRDVRTTTDASGAFTLNGLRVGSTYSIVAESQDEQGAVLTGRAQAKTSQTRVEIRLGSGDVGSVPKKAGRNGSRLRPVSNEEEVSSGDEGDVRPLINNEDVGGTDDAGDAEAEEKPRGKSQLPAADPAVGWRKGGTGTTKLARNQPDESEAEPVTAEAAGPDLSVKRRSARPKAPPAEVEDEDGPNPLPPAIEPNPADEAEAPAPKPKASARSKPKRKPAPSADEPATEPGGFLPSPDTRAGGDDSGTMVAQNSAGPATPSEPTPMPSMFPEMGSGPEAKVAQGVSADPPGATAAPPPMDQLAQSPASNNPASEPVFALPPKGQASANAATPPRPEPAEYNPFALAAAANPGLADAPEPAPAPRARAIIPATPRSTAPPVVAQQQQQPKSASPAAEPTSPASASSSSSASNSASKIKKKWGEVSTPEAKVATGPDAPRATSFLAKLRRTALDPRDGVVPTCDYDAASKRLVDFVLPDLQGNPVRFQDLDSDYVLLDFWGTRYEPCLDSIPYLIKLQKQYGPDKLRVVGIACEKDGPQASRGRVDQFTRRLGMNYPVLLSTDNGSDPVQAALGVKYHPTMVLLDRQGKVVWKQVGATKNTVRSLESTLSETLDADKTASR